jgi:hypothetical protein
VAKVISVVKVVLTISLVIITVAEAVARVPAAALPQVPAVLLIPPLMGKEAAVLPRL